MAKTRSWSVKGIDGETRDLARDAAQASGMTIGAWIDQAILRARNGELTNIAPAAPQVDAPADVPVVTSTGSGVETAGTTEPVAAEPVQESVQPAAPQRPSEPLIADPQDRLVSAETPAGIEPATDEAFAVRGVAPEISPDDSITGDSGDSDAGNGDFGAGGKSARPLPLTPPPARSSVLRYAVLGIFFVALLGVGGWQLIDLSSPDKTPTPRKIADASPTVEAPPPPPASSSTTAPIASPQVAPPSAPSPSAPTAATSAGLDGLPAELPDAMRAVISQAQSGNPKAQYNLGMAYLSGRLGDKNPAEAAKWFERAAAQGVANAQFNLGVLYQRGEGVAQNDKLAFFWFQSAAEQNFAQAQHNLATAYAEGRGIAQSYPKAAEWFAKSAATGLSQSQFSLGALHESGLITGQPNKLEARRWYEQALAQGDTRASVRLAVLDTPTLPGETSLPARTVATPVVVSPAAAAIGRAEIRQIQTLLGRMNFNPGPADGQMGKRTADAIRLYQKFAGMDEDGAPSRELLEDLQAVAETMARAG